MNYLALLTMYAQIMPDFSHLYVRSRYVSPSECWGYSRLSHDCEIIYATTLMSVSFNRLKWLRVTYVTIVLSCAEIALGCMSRSQQN